MLVGDNMKILTKQQVRQLRDFYPEGTKVQLIRMDDPQAPPAGTRGIITRVDDAGNIHVSWDNGSGLSLIPGKDEFIIIP